MIKTRPLPIVLAVTSQLAGIGHGVPLTESFDLLPPQVGCGQAWTNQNLILKFSPTVASEDSTPGYCSFDVRPGVIALYPARLQIDFSLLEHPVSRIEADVNDACGPGCTVLFAYRGPNSIGKAANLEVHSQTLFLGFNDQRPDRCVIRSFEGFVTEVRVYTAESVGVRLSIKQVPGSVAISWPTNAADYILEKTVGLSATPVWETEPSEILVEGTNFVHRPPLLMEAEFFRLRHR